MSERGLSLSPAVSDESVRDRAERFVDPLERLLYLRLESQLSSLTGHELSLLAQHSEGRSYSGGERLMREGAPAPAIHFLVEGTLSLRRQGLTYHTVRAPAVAGMISVLSRDKDGVEMVADENVVTLEVDANVLLDLVEDNFRFMEGALRGISQELQKCQRDLEIAGQLKRSEPLDIPYPEQSLDLIARLKFIRRGFFSDVNLEALIELIRGAEEVRYEAGAILWEVGEPADTSVHVVSGVIFCEEPKGERRFVMGPDSVVGLLEANANLPRSYRAVAQTRLVVIRSRVEDFFDVLEDNTQLGMGLLQAICTRLLELRMEHSGIVRSPPV